MSISVSNINQVGIPAQGPESERPPPTDPNAAPLEQNEKNLVCEGIHYKIVKEVKDPYSYTQLFSAISPSRKSMSKEIKKMARKTKKDKLQKFDDTTFAVKAG